MKLDPSYTENQKVRHKEHWSQRINGYEHDFQYENNYYHDFFREIPYKTVKTLLDSIDIELSNKNVLIAGCGNGIDIHYLQKYYSAKFFAIDISQDAVNLTIKLNPDVKGQVEDIEKLSFEDNSFDYSFAAHSIHHLPRPFLGIYELLRVSKYGVILVEPNDSFLPNVATKLGLITEFEKACKNYVIRFSKHDFERICKSCQCKLLIEKVFAIHRVAKNNIEFAVLRMLNSLSNRLIPFWSNYLIVYIEKTGEIK